MGFPQPLTLPSLSTAQKLAVDPANPLTAYAGGASGDGLYRTTDGGETWGLINLAQHSHVLRHRD